MNQSEILKMVREFIRQEVSLAMMGITVSNESQVRSTTQRFTTEAPVGNNRRVLPFGVSSRAPAGTQTLIIPVNGDVTNPATVGDFDSNRPVGNDGETLLYDAYGHVVYLSQSQVSLGSMNPTQNLVLGQIFKTFMDNLLEQLQEETHIGNLGYPTSPPVNAPAYAALQASPIDDESILSSVVFTE